jgi:hypothetical protein
MKFELERKRILIIPQTEEDEAYIEDTLGLTKAGDSILLKRINAYNVGFLGYLEAHKEE